MEQLTDRLVVLEDDTGSGKTEAAIWHWYGSFRAGRVDGLYFALPTRTAAMQMYKRLVSLVEHLFPDPVLRPTVVLAVPGYVEAEGHVGRMLPGFEVLWDDDPEASSRARRWAAESPRRYLAAPIAVGTVDQALLAALRVRHSHMRASALMRQLLVVDEVHASDVYMTAVLQRLLETHLNAGGHALLMSATLGLAVREQLLNRPLPVLDVTSRSPYPALTTESGLLASWSSVREREVTLLIEPVMNDPGEIARLAEHHARAGAATLVIRNTVADAVAVHRELDPSLSFRCEGVPTLHHSRFAREDRVLLDAAVEEVLGRTRETGQGFVIVGTQTLEQSLDIDADVLFTDLAPMDVLIQRMGRLHRHARARPNGYEKPTTHVLVPAAGLRPGPGPHGLGTVYPDVRILEATQRLLRERDILALPAVARELVELTTHPEALAEIEVLGDDWVAHGRDIEDIGLAHRGVAAISCVDRQAAFGSREAAWSRELDGRIVTRLGADDRILLLPDGINGPFGLKVRQWSVPGRWCRGVPPDAKARAEDGRIVWGSVTLDYDATGLRLEPC